MVLENQRDNVSLQFSRAPAPRPPCPAFTRTSICVSVLLSLLFMAGALHQLIGVVWITLETIRLNFFPLLFAMQVLWAGLLFILPCTLARDDSTPIPELRKIKLDKSCGRLFVWPTKAFLTNGAPYDIPLADVRFFRRLSVFGAARNAEGDVLMERIIFGIEVVSIRAPLHMTLSSNESGCIAAAAHLNDYLVEWRQQQTALRSPVSLISVHRPHFMSTTSITHATVLLPDPPPDSQFYFSYGSSDMFVCIRRRSFPRLWIFVFVIGILQWFISLLVTSRTGVKASFSELVTNAFVVTGTVLWLLPLLLTLFFWWKGDRWVFSSTGITRRRRFEFIGTEFDMSEASEVSRIELYVSQVPTIHTIRQGLRPKADFVGGERFGLRLVTSRNRLEWFMDGMFEGEALYIAKELREIYPQLCNGSQMPV